MRTFISVLISYIILCVLGVVLTSGLFMVYIGCMDYVVGQPLNLFSFHALKIGFDISLPLVVIFIPMFLILSLIRHSKKNRLIGLITTIVLTCCSWTIGVPAYIKYLKGSVTVTSLEKKRLSKGYFRLSENKLYYFTNVDSYNKSDGILIDTTKTETDQNPFRIIKNETVVIPGSEYFSDILVKRAVEIPEMLKLCFTDLFFISRGAYLSFSKSYTSWLFFCTFALALLFVFTLSSISQWRLINAFSVLVATGVVIKLNAVCFGVSMYNKYLPFLSGITLKLKNAAPIFSNMESPLSVIVNAVLILIFIILGIIGLLCNHSKSEMEEEDL